MCVRACVRVRMTFGQSKKYKRLLASGMTSFTLFREQNGLLGRLENKMWSGTHSGVIFFFLPCVCVQLSFVFGAQLHARSDVNRNDVVRSGGDWVYCREAPKGLFVKPSRLNYPEINPSDMSQTYSTV